MAIRIVRMIIVALTVAWAGELGLGVMAASPGPRSQQQLPAPRPGDQISIADIQSMFDAMAVLDAEKFVALTAEQYPVFVQKLKRLQDARKQLNQRRARAINELRMMVSANPANGKTVDDPTIDAKLKELDGFETDGRTAIGKALEDLDQLLSPRQRARFRLLEESTEKKKLDFLMKVRQQGGRGGI